VPLLGLILLEVMEQAAAALRNTVGSDVKILFSLSEALTASAAAAPATKVWLLLPCNANAGQDVRKALTEGNPQLAIVLVASERPVSQHEVLYAMEYGAAYVAATDLSSDLKVLRQAAEFVDGMSVVLLADPSIVQGDEKWTPFHYDPRREADGLSAFVADSDRVRKEIQTFVAKENLLTLIASKTLPSEDSKESTDDLSQGLVDAGKTVTILYSSDTGHAVECAKAIGRQCRGGGYAKSAVRVATMDSFDVRALASEPLVVFCISTAGKGEFPGNGRGFWDKLNDASAELEGKLSSMNYTMFGLGDSHYWGKGTEDSKVNFAKPARDLDALLEKLGAPRFMPMGFGDDQDPDQYHTGFGEWRTQLFSRLGVDKADAGGGDDDGPVKSDEVIKCETNQLRGTLRSTLDDVSTGQVPFQDTKVIKFHGSYQQDDRDLRDERQQLGIEPAFSFMIRVRMPGGFCTAEQWLAMDDICENYANGTLKITTRQTWQVHGVLKRNVKETMRAMNRACMDTIAACGDVCRNVLCTSDPRACSREVMDEVLGYTYEIHDHCLPRTGGYHEVYIMDGPEMKEKCQVLGSSPVEEEPLYGKTYLPRKYKVAVAIPPSNDVDVFAHDCGFIAIIEKGKLLGFNVTVGGGLGFTHNMQKTHPRLADVIGFCQPQDAKYVCECVMTVSRDYGDRTGRKHARIKYTMEDYGKDFFREQVEERLGKKLEPARPYNFEYRGDFFGWMQTEDGLWHCGVLVPIGRVKNKSRTALVKICEELKGVGVFRMTCNQGLLISDIPDSKKAAFQQLLDTYEVPYDLSSRGAGGLKRNMMACVALPTCPLAFAEAERYLPTLVDKLQVVTDRLGIGNEDIAIRMTGCPNSCGRPSLGEIGFIGKAPGTYNMYLGADFVGERLNTLYAESVTEDQIIAILTPMFEKFAGDREKGEKFGDFVVRQGFVKPMVAGRLWWSLPQV
jgi:sulfite reductase (NADPH) hemoprotein beta-component